MENIDNNEPQLDNLNNIDYICKLCKTKCKITKSNNVNIRLECTANCNRNNLEMSFKNFKLELNNIEKENKNKGKCGFCFIGQIISYISLFIIIFSLQYKKLAIAIYKDIFEQFFNKKQIIKSEKTIIGIDFGSTHSKYAIISEGEIIDNLNFDDSLIPLITSELITDGSEPYNPIKIGYEQAHLYSKNNLYNENKLYFSKFKINLDPNNFNNNIIEADIPKNKSINLDKVIEGYFTLLRKKINDDNRNLRYNNNVKWILTIPSLWDENSKKFMKEVVFQAGINNAEIALEIEAASLSIFYDKNINREEFYLTKGNSFILVDAGGYTVDISANKILDDDNNLEQIIVPNSTVLGSTLINKQIIEIIEFAYGKKAIDESIKNNYDAFQKVLDKIESLKKDLNEFESPKSIDFKNFIIPINFIKGNCDGKWFGDQCEKAYYNMKISYTSQEILIPSSLILKIINSISEKIITEILKSFSKTNEIIKTVIITGGFSNCKILRQKIEEKFDGPKKLLFLNYPQNTVAKGAAIFGLKPNQILKRKSPITIGVESFDYLNEHQECEQKAIDEDGLSICLKNITFVKMEESIETNKLIEKNIKPLYNEIKIYYRKNEKLSNKGKLLEKFELPSSDIPLKNRTITISFKFTNYIYITIADKQLNEEISKLVFYP